MKNKILMTITGIALMSVLLGASGFDSEDLTIPILMMVIPMFWLIPFGIANDGYFEDDDESED